MAEPPVLEAAPADKAKAADKAGKGDKADKADKAEKPKKGDKAKAEGEAAPAGGKKKLILIIAIAAVVLGGGGAGAFFMFGGKHDEEPAKGKDKAHAAQKKEAEKEKDEPPPEGPPLFVALDPPFVVNFEAEELVRFLQVTAQLMTRDPETVELLKTNDPIIRNDLLLLLGNQHYQTIATREGKEALRNQALEAVRKVVKSAGGKPKNVEAVYFTSFVMQ